jgi:hypothetical protein
MSFTLVEPKDFLTHTSNKWVLNTTTTPLFFLWAQLAIAALLFIVSDALRLLPDRLTLDLATCKGLIPMVGLNVFGLRSVVHHFVWNRINGFTASPITRCNTSTLLSTKLPEASSSHSPLAPPSSSFNPARPCASSSVAVSSLAASLWVSSSMGHLFP